MSEVAMDVRGRAMKLVLDDFAMTSDEAYVLVDALLRAGILGEPLNSFSLHDALLAEGLNATEGQAQRLAARFVAPPGLTEEVARLRDALAGTLDLLHAWMRGPRFKDVTWGTLPPAVTEGEAALGASEARHG